MLDILPVGPPSRRAADLVGSGLAAILEQASAEYDLIMGMTDPDLVKWNPDTGHIIRGGQDLVDTLRRYGDRIIHVHLKDVDRDTLASQLSGEPPYRVAQVWDGLYRRNVEIEAMTDLPRALRSRLAEALPPALSLAREQVSDA